MLAVLLLNANEPVSSERLATALWGDDAPAGAVKTVQVRITAKNGLCRSETSTPSARVRRSAKFRATRFGR